MGVGDGQAGLEVLEAAHRAARHDRRPAAERPPRAQVDRRVQAARGHARRRGRHAARRALLRVPRPPDLDRDPADPRLPRPEPALVRRPRQLLDGRRASRSSSPRSTTTRSTRCAGWTSRSRPPPRPTTRRSRCSPRSACRSLAGPPEGFDPEADAAAEPPSTPSRGAAEAGSRSRSSAEAEARGGRAPSSRAAAEEPPPSSSRRAARRSRAEEPAAEEPQAADRRRAEEATADGGRADRRRRAGRGERRGDPTQRTSRPTSDEKESSD